ncbi:MAG: DUF3352 domain-containing protein [Oculatellaceae cyanobacterium Prado106]|jgi:hypothetical protein|nr:DUF3352 domain-containing protein [Oculatellaceae cyanobacterium Prado106]
MKSRTFFTALVVAALALLLVGATGAYWLAANSPLSETALNRSPQLTAIQFVSRRSPLVFSLSVNPDEIGAYRLAKTSPPNRRPLLAHFQKFQQQVLAQTPLDYGRDIHPWIGDELAAAVTTTDLDRDRSNGTQPGYLVAIATDRPQQAETTLQKFWQQQAAGGKAVTSESYDGVEIVSAIAPPDQSKADRGLLGLKQVKVNPAPLASARVGDRFVLFANHPKVLREAIHNVQVAELNLGQSPQYQQALERLPDRPLGLAFVNLPRVESWLNPQSTAQAGQEHAETLDTDASDEEVNDSLAFALQLQPQGLLIESLIFPTTGKVTAQPPRFSAPVDAIRYVPENSLWTLVGAHPQQFWQAIAAELKGYDALTANLPQPLDTLKSQWDADLAENLLDSLEDESAVARLPRTDGAPADWVFITRHTAKPVAETSIVETSVVDELKDVESNDVESEGAEPETKTAIADTGFAGLDAIAQERGISIGSLTLGDSQIAAWTKIVPTAKSEESVSPDNLALQAKVEGVHTVIGKYAIFATSLEAMEQVLQASQATPSGKTTEKTTLQQAIAPLSPKNNGYLYLEGEVLRQWIDQAPALNPIADSIDFLAYDVRSLTFSPYGKTAKGQRSGFLVQLKS